MNVCFLASTFPRYKNDSQSPFVMEQVLAWKNKYPHDNLYLLLPDDNLYKQKRLLSGINLKWFSYFPIKSWQVLAYPSILPNISKNPWQIFLIPFFLLAQSYNLFKLVKKNDIDLIYAHWITPQGISAFIVSKIIGIPYILHNHSSDAEILHKIPLVGKHILKEIIRNSKICYCVNKSQRLHLKQICSSANILVRPMGIKKPDFRFLEIEPEYDLGFIGRLSEKKGIFNLLRFIKSSNNRYSLIVAGSGELEKRLKQYAIKHHLNVKFVGFVSENEKERFFSSFNIFVLLSKIAKNDREGLPVSLLEALSRNKLCLVSSETNIEHFVDWNLIKKRVLIVDRKKLNNDYLFKSVNYLLDRYNLDYNSKILEDYFWENYITRFRNDINTVLD